LNLTTELHLAQNQNINPMGNISSKLANLRQKIEIVLENH
jgi:hypothetical protein